MIQRECPSPFPSISASTGMSKCCFREAAKRLLEVVWRPSDPSSREANSVYVSIVMSVGEWFCGGREWGRERTTRTKVSEVGEEGGGRRAETRNEDGVGLTDKELGHL